MPSDSTDSPLVLGVDSSTQSTKVEARELASGVVVASGSAPHPTTTPPVSEQDPAAWWAALVQACGQLGDVRSRVVAMSVAGQQHGFVMLDEGGDSIRPAKLWNDTTSAEVADALLSDLGGEYLAQVVGSVPGPAFTIAKMAWMRANEPESLDRTDKVMLPHDYLTWRLTGEHVTDRGDASGTGWFDPTTASYVPDLLNRYGADVGWLPRVLGQEEAAGSISGEAAAALGLPDSTIVGPGTGDNMAGSLGLGMGSGDIVISLGTSGVAYTVSPTPTADPSGIVAGFADATGKYLPLICTLNATKVTDTMANWLGTDAAGLSDLAAQADPAQSSVLIPYFSGERTPNLPFATGSMFGLRTDTTREELALAAHDGVLCGLLDGLDSLRSIGVPADGTLNLIGGGSRAATYQQRCADLWGSPVVLPDGDEIVATGAAVQAAAVSGGGSLGEVQSRWSLGSGRAVAPRENVDAQATRRRYTEHAAVIAQLNDK